jgi:hypothetical protein
MTMHNTTTQPPLSRAAFTQSEVAARFGFSFKTWQRMVADGKAPKPDIEYQRTKRWSAKLLDQWLESSRSR